MRSLDPTKTITTCRHTLTRFASIAAVLSISAGVTACLADGQEPEDLASETSSLSLLPSPSLTLYSEAGFWGDQLAVSITPTLEETVRLVTKTQIEAANLLGRISSVRLTCGDREGDALLFMDYNTATTLSGWSPYGTASWVHCRPGEVRSVNLHVTAPSYADRVASVYFVSHARDAHEFAFTDFLTLEWNARMAEISDSHVSADGDPQLRLVSNTRFRIVQFLNLDDALCGARGGRLELDALMNQNGHFTVSVVDVYVDTGWGDSWGCRDQMTSAVDAGAHTAAQKLTTGLDSLLVIYGTGARDYFTPTTSLRAFRLMTGGDPIVKTM
jgi:hypothetical protein